MTQKRSIPMTVVMILMMAMMPVTTTSGTLWRVGILVSRSLLNLEDLCQIKFATFQDAVEGVTYVRPGVHCVEVTLSEGDGGGLKYDLTLTSSNGHPFLEIRCWGCE